MNGKQAFNLENLKNEIKKDFDNYYLIEKTKKEADLFESINTKKIIFKPPINSQESFEDFIKNQNIDFSFKKKNVINKLTFRGSSTNIDKLYQNFIDNRDFKADSSIFQSYFDSLIEKARKDEEIIRENEELKKKLLI